MSSQWGGTRSRNMKVHVLRAALHDLRIRNENGGDERGEMGPGRGTEGDRGLRKNNGELGLRTSACSEIK